MKPIGSENGLREIRLDEGRCAFGRDPANYDAARPEYPDRVYAILAERCGLAPGAALFEIGPGTGLATRRLLDAGADPLVAIEPDQRLAAVLSARAPQRQLQVVDATFEQAELPAGRFDLGVAATSFHWMEQRPALAKVATLLRPGGWWAMWWNVFGDPAEPDPFHEATRTLLAGGVTPSFSPTFRHPFALDRDTRRADLEADGLFDTIGIDVLHWPLLLDTRGMRALYATYSQFAPLADAKREALLDALSEIADRQFNGRVERRMVTVLYTACRRNGADG